MSSKCLTGCTPSVDKPQNLQPGVLYAVACNKCGNHILFSLPGQRKRLTEFLMLGEQVPLKMEGRVDPSFRQVGDKYGHCYSLPAVITDFKNGTGFDKERDMEILYEMLGDGEIELDLFNSLSAKIALR